MSNGQIIDWDVAVSTGTRFARPGPQVSLAEARQTVAELRELSVAVERPVREVTKLQSKVAPGKVAVVDRAGWIRANVDGFRVVLDPLAEQMRQRTPAASAGGLVMGVGSRISGAQAGLILSYLSSRVLGQYELFLPPGSGDSGEEPVGRLTLVAPNIVMVERELQVNPTGLPPLGLPARRDPPGAVHLGAVAAGLRPGPDERVPARLRPGPGRDPQPAPGRR